MFMCYIHQMNRNVFEFATISPGILHFQPKLVLVSTTDLIVCSEFVSAMLSCLVYTLAKSGCPSAVEHYKVIFCITKVCDTDWILGYPVQAIHGLHDQ